MTAASGVQGNRYLATARRVFGTQEGILLLLLVLLIIGVGLYNPRFLNERNLTDVFNANAYIAVAAIGISMIIITGNIDISVGAAIGVLVSLSGTIAEVFADSGVPTALVIAAAWIAPLFGGMLISAVNGFFVAYLGIPAIVVTLGTFSILRGGLIFVAGGNTITDLPDGYGVAQQSIGPVPVAVIIMIILTIIAFAWMRWSRLGRFQYAIGGNKEAARLSGIDVRTSLMKTFIIAGFFYGVAAVMYATQFNTIQTVVVPGLELQVITAAVVGGVSILGGIGTVIGSTLAAILIRTIGVSLIFIDISAFWLRAILGVLILVTVLADVVRRRRQERM
ncbi:MAG: ABC transporter permease [Chloroflexota bacterium]|jgi:ribose/xylose/arabinose/galactoside ABC-type transport system permease subunit